MPFNRSLQVLSAAELKEKIHLHAQKLETFHGKATIQMQTQTGIIQGTIELITHQPDSIWMKIEGPMGVDMGIMQMIHGDVVLFSPWENILYTGSLKELAIFNQFILEWEPEQILSGILGLIQPGMRNDTLTNFEMVSRHYVFNYKNGGKFWVTPKGPVVDKWEIYTANKPRISWIAEEFRNKSGIQMPRLIRIQKHDTGERFALTYYYTKANSKLNKDWYQIEIPEGVTRIEL